MNQANTSERKFSVEILDDEPSADSEQKTGFDYQNPILASATQAGKKKKKSWKRRALASTVLLFLIIGVCLLLYAVSKKRSVTVLVQADKSREGVNSKPTPSPGSSENTLSAEAINIARQAIGDDRTATTAGPFLNPGPSPSPSPEVSSRLNYSATVNSDLGPANDSGTTNIVTQPNSATSQPNLSPANAYTETDMATQSRSNVTQTIFVDDIVPNRPVVNTVPVAPRSFNPSPKPTKVAEIPKPAILPPFGTVLPVRTQGVVFTVRNNALARLELTRDCSGNGWSLPKGTVLIGRTSGSEADRAFINVIGYIDAGENRLVKLSGELLGPDGGTGLPGKRSVPERRRLGQALRKVASAGLQVAGMAAGALSGRGTVVIDGAGYRLMNPLRDEAERLVSGSEQRTFIKVAAGQSGYVLISDLPQELRGVDATGSSADDDKPRESNRLTTSLSDGELMELMLFGTPDELRAALPLMNEEQKRFALRSLVGPAEEKAQP